MKIFFLAPYPLDEVASQRFRFEQYFALLNERGYSWSFGAFYNRYTYRHLYDGKSYLIKIGGVLAGYFRRIIHVFRCMPVDYVFIHRELTPFGPPIYEWIISKILKKKIIYDFDDAIWIPPNEHKISGWHKLRSYRKINKICRWSEKISCGNEYLAEYARKYNRNVMVNPTVIDTNRVDPAIKRSADPLIYIGWTGTHSTLKYLDTIKDILIRILNDFPNSRFLVISNKKPDWEIKGMEFVYWKKESEIEDLARTDIGLMPLTRDEWSLGKCGFKLLQYFSIAIPAVASPVGVNKKIIRQDENGYLCETGDQWYRSIARLIENPELREEMGRRGRKLLEDHFSVTANRTTFFRLFE